MDVWPIFFGQTEKHVCESMDKAVFVNKLDEDINEMIPEEYEVYVYGGKKKTKMNHIEYSKYLLDLGVGEIILQNIDLDGTMKGFNMNLINELFNGNIQTIITNLKSHNSEFSKKILDILLVKCPMSLAISTKLIDDAKGKSLKECLETEFQLSQKIVYRSDFDNGVNSVLISKDHNPIWEPSKIDEINIEDLDFYFETHTENLYL